MVESGKKLNSGNLVQSNENGKLSESINDHVVVDLEPDNILFPDDELTEMHSTNILSSDEVANHIDLSGYDSAEYLVKDNSTILDGVTPDYESVSKFINDYLTDYWHNLQSNGLGVSQIDDLVVLLVIIRLIYLSIRYNILTATAISAVTVFSGYLWYSAFLSTIFGYEQELYLHPLTRRLAVDSTQIRTIIQAQIKVSDYNIRLTNPIGILCHAITRASIHDGYRIDIISMAVTKAPEFIRFRVHGWYYFLYGKLIPLAIRVITQFAQQLISFGAYTYVVRVNKRLCPYLIRWHWSNIIMFRFLENYLVYVSMRANTYAYAIVLPKILQAREFNLRLPNQEFEMQLFINFSFFIMVFHMLFWLYGMLHALCGQYFYIPFYTENVELHIGPRPKTGVYSGGYTAWQDSNEKPKRLFSKFWYGWLGRGTKKPSLILILFRRLIFRPIYGLIKSMLRFIKRR